jgi:hypothetical protein
VAEHQWYYRHESALGTVETIGPINETKLQALALEGTLRAATLLASPTRTAGKWALAQAIPGIVKLINQGEENRRAEREREANERNQLATQQALVVQHQHAAVEAERQEIAMISHSQNVALVKGLKEKVSSLLTPAESIVYIAVQEKPLINLAPDAILATNRRLIFYRSKMLGRYEFQDFMWLDIRNAHVQKNLLGAVFTCQHTSGARLVMDYLPQLSAEALYRLAQEGEERAHLARRQLDLETRRAGAANISTNVNVAGPGPSSSPVEATVVESNGPLKKLETLKSMLDKQLISQADFESAKASILAQL